MSHLIFRFFALICISAALVACGVTENCQKLEFSSLAQANRMRIATNLDKTIRETTDQAEIASLIKFISTHTENWCEPWAGVPIGLARAELYVDKKILGSISLGSNFAGTAGPWRIRALENAERKELLHIFNIPDPYAK